MVYYKRRGAGNPVVYGGIAPYIRRVTRGANTFPAAAFDLSLIIRGFPPFVL